MKRYFILTSLAILAFAGVAQAQTPPVKNPGGVTFTSVDHNSAAVTGYTVEILRPDNSVLSTIQVAKSATTIVDPGTVATGPRVRINLNVQPIAFGNYTLRLFTVATATAPATGSVLSDPSPNSDVWERVPGPPSKGTLQ